MTTGEFISMLCRVGTTEDTLRFMYGNREIAPAAVDINFDAREVIVSLEEVRDLSDEEKHGSDNVID